MTFITITDVRRACGAPSSLITDSQITSIIAEVEEEMERWLNTKFTPTTRIDILDGSGSEVIYVTKKPLLAVRSVNTNDTDVSIDGINYYRESGKVYLNGDGDASVFQSKPQDTKIKYVYGWVVPSGTETSTTADASAGTSQNISVSDSSDFSADDWVEITGTDGHKEAAKITAVPNGTTITVEEVSQSHASGSLVQQLTIPQFIKRYMEIEAGIYAAINAIGATYTFNASYSLGELSVVKGVPYTHWRESVQRLIDERKMRQDRIKPRFHMAT